MASKLFKFAVPSLESAIRLSNLDGLTVWHETRLEEEDVENVPNMSTVDIVDLMVNTRIPAGRIVDWVDQAILLTHLGITGKDDDTAAARKALAGLGIRTASSLLAVHSQSPDSLSTALESPAAGRLNALVVAVQTNNNLTPILHWHGESNSR